MLPCVSNLKPMLVNPAWLARRATMACSAEGLQQLDLRFTASLARRASGGVAPSHVGVQWGILLWSASFNPATRMVNIEP